MGCRFRVRSMAVLHWMFIRCVPRPPPTVSVTLREEPTVQQAPDCQLTASATLVCGASVTLDGSTETQVIRFFPRHVNFAVPDFELMFVTMKSVSCPEFGVTVTVAGLAIDVVKMSVTELLGAAGSWEVVGSPPQPSKLKAPRITAAPRTPGIRMIPCPFDGPWAGTAVQYQWFGFVHQVIQASAPNLGMFHLAGYDDPRTSLQVDAEAIRLILRLRLDWLSATSLDVIDKLVGLSGEGGNADTFARCMGLRSRHQLLYQLHRDGLPPYRDLANWIRLAFWMAEVDSGEVSLCRAALTAGHDPAFRYRVIRRVTGITWTELRPRGLLWLMEELVARCSRPARGANVKENAAGA